MKLLLTFAFILMLLGASAGGSYLFFKQSAVADSGKASQAAIDKKAIKAGHAEEIKKKLIFVELEPMILPIIDEYGIQQLITLVVAIEVESDEKADRVKDYSPRLKDAFIQDMYGVLNRKASLEGGVLRVDRLKKRLSKVSIGILGEGSINEVLLQVVQQNPV